MNEIIINDQITIRQVAARTWEVWNCGSCIYRTHKGEKQARKLADLLVVRSILG